MILRIASNTQDFINFIIQFYGTISDFCNAACCPVMQAGPNCEYFWIDSQKKNIRIPAAQYVDYVLSWAQNILRDEAMFPTKAGI